MKLKIYDSQANEKGDIELPVQFTEAVRPDMIKRAVLVQRSRARVPYGATPLAGKKYSSYVSKRRRDYKGTYGKGISRTPRKILTRRGIQFYWVGAFAPQTVGGRRAHPPKAKKNWVHKINKKERRAAIRSALAATTKSEIVKKHGFRVPENYPFVLDVSFEQLAKTKDVVAALEKIGFSEELKRTKQKIVRSGKGTMRGRKYRRKVGPLLVVSSACALEKSARNIPGVEVTRVNMINPSQLAPGAHPGRATLFTKGALEELSSKNLYY